MIRPRHLRMAWRFVQRRFRELHPFEVQATLLNACNLRCVYCRCPEVKTSLMSTEQWHSVIRELASLGMMRIKFQGGEPTMRSDFKVISRAAQDQGVITAAITNGVLIPGQPNLLDHLDELVVSLDSPLPEPHDQQRGAGTWKAAVETIGLARRRGLRVYVNMVVTRPTLPLLEPMLEFCESHGIPLNAQPVMFDRTYYDEAARPLALTQEEIKHMHQTLVDWKCQGRQLMFSVAAYSKVLEWPHGDRVTVRSSGESSCMAGRDYVHIEANGDVLPCLSHAATFIPKNVLHDGLRTALRHAGHHNCGDCWIAYLNERKLAFGLHPQALLQIIHRG